ncbi:MAG: hypothetical protein U0271_04755 [Polyangiaceae bacterium]
MQRTRWASRPLWPLVLWALGAGCAAKESPKTVAPQDDKPAAQPMESSSRPASDREACLIVGEGYLITVTPPKGWRALCGDELPAGRRELAIVLPEGSSTEPLTPPFMYLGLDAKPASTTLATFIADGNDQIVQGMTQSGQKPPAITAHDSLTIYDGTAAPVWLYALPSSHRFEETSFSAFGDKVVMVSLLTSEGAQLGSLERPFADLVASLRFAATQ